MFTREARATGHESRIGTAHTAVLTHLTAYLPLMITSQSVMLRGAGQTLTFQVLHLPATFPQETISIRSCLTREPEAIRTSRAGRFLMMSWEQPILMAASDLNLRMPSGYGITFLSEQRLLFTIPDRRLDNKKYYWMVLSCRTAPSFFLMYWLEGAF